jgi:hypothetical protein
MILNLRPAWLNNCVGFYNHRYFFSFCVYITMAAVYVTCVTYDLFIQEFYGTRVSVTYDLCDLRPV